MEKLQKMKNKKGFTLIEIIVVLIIVAILAAVAIPTMMGYVEEARGRTLTQEARMGLIAAQWIVTDAVGTGTAADAAPAVQNIFDDEHANHTRFNGMVSGVAAAAVAADDVEGFTAFRLDGDQVVGVYYRAGNIAVLIDDGNVTAGRGDNMPARPTTAAWILGPA